MRRLIQLVVPCVLLSGCFGPSEGVEVPRDQIYFPVGLAMDKSGSHLFVVSSDFDLQYNGGAVQSYDLEGLKVELPQPCSAQRDCTADWAGSWASTCDEAIGMCVPELGKSPCPQGDRADADRLLFPGRCNPIEPTKAQVDSVKIGAFATDALLRRRSTKEPQRLFVPVRGDSTLHWIDVDEKGALDCGQQGSADHACNDAHRAGDDPTENTRGLTLGTEPFGIDADDAAQTIVLTNQTTGTASLFVTGDEWAAGPKLAFALASDQIPLRPVAIAAVPDLPADPNDRFAGFRTYMMTFRNSPQVRLLRFAPDDGLDSADRNNPRPYLVDEGGIGIDANAVGSDSRGIAIDDSARKDAEGRCATGDKACTDAAALVPLDVYVTNRSPSSLLIGRTQPPQQYPSFFKTIPLTTGPSRVVVGKVPTPGGGEEARVFVACFDSRRIFVYDPTRGRVETEILTGRGPHAMVVDKERRLLYVGHFTDSYVGVYSLDLESPTTYGTLLGTLGTPKSPRSSK